MRPSQIADVSASFHSRLSMEGAWRRVEAPPPFQLKLSRATSILSVLHRLKCIRLVAFQP